jgi:hypothetical protein
MTPELAIALLAVVFTAYQAYLSREHNRVSVMPSVGTTIHWDARDDGIELSYSLVNYGLGPARIKKMDLLFQKQKFDTAEHAPVEELIKKACDGRLALHVDRSALPRPGFCILAQSEYLLFRAFFPKLKRGEESRIKSALEILDFHLVYESVYGHRFELTSVGEKRG